MNRTREQPVPEAPGLETVREVLERAVRTVCPAWMADDRDDLVQSAYLRVLKVSRGGKESGPLAASYLWRVAHSVVMDEIRRRRRRREDPLEEAQMHPAGVEGGPESDLRGEEILRTIREGLAKLSDSRRLAVLLYLHGFGLADSARILGWTTKRVDNQRYQGLSELRRFLRERGAEP
jgi:RNA polymerase sigma-70 factor (ECF subfamily)